MIGLIPLADEVTTHGIVVTEIGLDHYRSFEDYCIGISC
jgi:hypothetical protein